MLTVGGMFDGAGLLALGLHRAGLRHLWLCERDEWRRSILAARFPGTPVLDDVHAIGAGTVEPVDVIAGGFPCKGASTAGKRTGLDHPETALWREMRRSIGELRPRYAVVENVANLLALHRGAVWGEVLGDLATLGYRVWWDCWPAAAFGAPHLRDRLIAVAAHPDWSRAAADTAGRGSREAVGERGLRLAPDSLRSGLEGRGLQGPVADRTALASDASRDGEGGSGPEGGADRERARERADAGRAAPADANGGRGEAGPQQDSGTTGGLRASLRHDADGRGVRVEWGDYEPAIRRWEAIVGPAPSPLVRRMDDGPPQVRRLRARVDRSRLSALGDGVQLQLGEFAGRLVLSLEAERLRMVS